MPVRLVIGAKLDYPKTKGRQVKGCVIMPNHLHALIDFGISEKNINTIVSNGKRFMPAGRQCL